MPRQAYQSKPLFNFGGPTRNALVARNVRYAYQENAEPGGAAGSGVGYAQCKVRTRAGHANAFNPAASVKSMYNFIATDPTLSTPVNALFYFTGSEVKVWDLISSTIGGFNPALTTAGLKASVAQAGTRAYIAMFDQNAIGAAQGHVVDTSGNNDKLFEPPPLNTKVSVAAVDAATGVVTAGVHNLALCIGTRTGYTTIPGPVDSITGLFIPLTITSAGGKKLSVTVNGIPWPTAASTVSVLMTTSTNLAKYFFVPTAVVNVPGGSSFSFTFPINIDDADLEQAVAADDFFNLYAQNPLTGTGPFNPSFVCAYGSRMVYGAGDRVYISDPNDYQSITADQHVVFLPGLQNIRTAFPHRDGNLYLVGDNWTYAVSDTGDVPQTWPAPQAIDTKIGTIAVNGVSREPTQNQALVATESGLRLFENGGYDDPPLSFWVTDWARINWAAAATIELLDDLEEQTIRVLVPLDGATAPNYEMTFDYKSGKTPTAIRYSLNDAPGRYCFALVQNATTNRREVWLGPTDAGQVWRRDKSLTADAGAQIANQTYETQLLFGIEELGGPAAFHGAHFTANGTALLGLTGYTTQHKKQTEKKQTDLFQQGGTRILRQWLLNGENESLEFSAAAGWFELIEVEPYYSPWLRQR